MSEHYLLVSPTGETGIHSGRSRYRAECSCGVLLHENTTGPETRYQSHLREEIERLHREMTSLVRLAADAQQDAADAEQERDQLADENRIACLTLRHLATFAQAGERGREAQAILSTWWEVAQADVDAVVGHVLTLRREKDALQRAKDENDERYLTERDEARRERDEAIAREVATVERIVAWLRREESSRWLAYAQAADAIERGAHEVADE